MTPFENICELCSKKTLVTGTAFTGLYCKKCHLKNVRQSERAIKEIKQEENKYLEDMKIKWAKIFIKRIKLNTGMNITDICCVIKCDRGNLTKVIKGQRSLPLKTFCDLIDLDKKIFANYGKKIQMEKDKDE